MSKKQKDLKLINYVVLGKFSDGKCRQILLSETDKQIIDTLLLNNGKLRVLDTVLETVDIE